MNIQLSKIKHIRDLSKVIIDAHDCSIYLVSVVIGKTEHIVVDKSGRAIRSSSKLELQRLFLGIEVGTIVLRHESAYDEMIGQPMKTNNLLEVPLGGSNLN